MIAQWIPLWIAALTYLCNAVIGAAGHEAGGRVAFERPHNLAAHDQTSLSTPVATFATSATVVAFCLPGPTLRMYMEYVDQMLPDGSCIKSGDPATNQESHGPVEQADVTVLRRYLPRAVILDAVIFRIVW